MKRRLRKHRAAVIAFAVYNLVLFFPVLFMGRVLSPNDVVYATDPWSFHRPASVSNIQNRQFADVPSSLLGALDLLRDDPGTLHWNPYVAAGSAGSASAGSPIISPLVLLPALLVPLVWACTAIVFAKLNLAFLFSYAWLREERLGKSGAAAGAIVAGGAGVLAVRWLGPMTSAAVLYPLLLFVVRRAFDRRPLPVWLLTIAFVTYLLAASPAAMAYGAVLAVAYSVFLALRLRRVPAPAIGKIAVAILLAVLITLPAVIPYAKRIEAFGVREARAGLSVRQTFPSSQWAAFIAPERLGSPAFRNWLGDKQLGILNSFAESTLYIGLFTLPLVFLALFNRRARGRFFWIGTAVVVLCASFGLFDAAQLVRRLPGFDYAPITRLVLLLPVIAGFLTAAGTAVVSRFLANVGLRRLAWGVIPCLVALVAADLGVFAGRYQPYLRVADAGVPPTATTSFLREQPAPFRIAPMFNYLWPDGAQFYRVEDVRSRFPSDPRYRRFLQRIDPTTAPNATTAVEFNSLKFDVNDPLVGMLGIRYLIEHRSIDILKWGTFAATQPATRQLGGIRVPSGLTLLRAAAIDADPYYAIEIPVSVDTTGGAKPHLDVALIKGGEVRWSRKFSDADIRVMNKIYVPVRPYARSGDVIVLRVRAVGMNVWVTRSELQPGQAPIFYGRVTSPLIFDREFVDGRVFRYLGELPRFRASSAVRSMSDDEFIATKNIDFAAESILTGRSDQAVEAFADRATVKLLSWTPREQRVQTDAAEPMFLATSEKLSPELAVTIDGRRAEPVEINMLFAGVRVPAGRHEVVLTRSMGRDWWVASAVGAVLLCVSLLVEVSVARRRGSPGMRRETSTARS